MVKHLDTLSMDAMANIWRYYGQSKRTFTSKPKAQVYMAKLTLQGKKAEMYEKREHDFSGWKR